MSVTVTSQESAFMPSAWRSRLHTSLKRSWGRPVGLFNVFENNFGLAQDGKLGQWSVLKYIMCFRPVVSVKIHHVF